MLLFKRITNYPLPAHLLRCKKMVTVLKLETSYLCAINSPLWEALKLIHLIRMRRPIAENGKRKTGASVGTFERVSVPCRCTPRIRLGDRLHKSKATLIYRFPDRQEGKERGRLVLTWIVIRGLWPVRTGFLKKNRARCCCCDLGSVWESNPHYREIKGGMGKG